MSPKSHCWVYIWNGRDATLKVEGNSNQKKTLSLEIQIQIDSSATYSATLAPGYKIYHLRAELAASLHGCTPIHFSRGSVVIFIGLR